MKSGQRTLVNLSQPGKRHETRERFEQSAPGVFFFDVALTGEAAVGVESPLFVQVCTPSAGLPRDFGYRLTVSQGARKIYEGLTSLGSLASLKINCKVDSERLVTVKVEAPGSRRRFGLIGPWEPPVWVYLQARKQQGAENV